MSRGPRFRVPFRRRREGKTDYRRRLRLLRSRRARAVVRFSNTRVRVVITQFDPGGDRVVASAESAELAQFGFPKPSLNSTPASYLTGYLAGLRAKRSGTSSAVLDAGVHRPTHGGRLLGALKGLIDAGVEIPHSAEGLPTSDRLAGTHLKVPLATPLERFREQIAGSIPVEGTVR